MLKFLLNFFKKHGWGQEPTMLELKQARLQVTRVSLDQEACDYEEAQGKAKMLAERCSVLRLRELRLSKEVAELELATKT